MGARIYGRPARRRAAWLVACLLSLGAAGQLDAQIAWDTPRMMGPESPTGFGVHWMRSSALGPELDAGMGCRRADAGGWTPLLLHCVCLP